MLASGGIDWTTVIVAAFGALPGSLAAFIALRVRQQIRTPSGESIGTVAEKAHHTGIANNLLLRKLNGIPHSEEES